jgi:hypothetical protein
MTPNTPEDVSDERLAELIEDLDAIKRTYPDPYSDVQAGLRQLQRHRARTGYHANCKSCTCAFPSEEGT